METVMPILKTFPWQIAAVLVLIFYGWRILRSQQKEQREYADKQNERFMNFVQSMNAETAKRTESRNESQRYITEKLAEVSVSTENVGKQCRAISNTLDKVILQAADTARQIEAIDTKLELHVNDRRMHK